MDVSADDVAALFAAVSTWGRWGDSDERGALHHLTPARVVAAAGLVRDGITASMSFPVVPWIGRLAPCYPAFPAAPATPLVPELWGHFSRAGRC